MENFKTLYEQVIEATFSEKLHRMLYENELTTERPTKENRDTFRDLFQRYKDLRKLGDAEFVEEGLRDRMYALNKGRDSSDNEKRDEDRKTFTKIMEIISDTSADLPYICASCCTELWESTKYCLHCGRLNIEFKEETNNG